MFWQQLINGLVIGSIYSVLAIGYSMVYGMIRMMNFAHGDILMFGTFLTITFILIGIPLPLAILLGIVTGTLVALFVAALAYMPLLNRPRNGLVLSSVGASFLLVNSAQLIWGTSVKPFPFIDDLPTSVHQVGNLIISDIQIIVLVTCLVSMLLLTLFVQTTKVGIAMRATSDNMVAANLMGISPRFIVYATFAIGSIMAVIGGVLVAISYNSIWPTMGFKIGLAAFSASILGGIGSIPGAMLGGIIIGIGESLGASYVSSGFRDGVAFAVLIITLLIRPWGLLGKPEVENI